MQPNLTIPDAPGAGPAWARLAATLAETIPVAEIDGIWTFRPLRRDLYEFGTAIVSRVEGNRRRIYTGRYAHTIKGRDRGTFEAQCAEVGSGPLETLDELLTLVPRRSDEDPPDPVSLDLWYPPIQEEPPAD